MGTSANIRRTAAALAGTLVLLGLWPSADTVADFNKRLTCRNSLS